MSENYPNSPPTTAGEDNASEQIEGRDAPRRFLGRISGDGKESSSSARSHGTDLHPRKSAADERVTMSATQETGESEMPVERPRLVRRNGVTYVQYRVQSIPRDPQARVDQIIANLKSDMPTDAQQAAIETVVRPALEKLKPE